MQRVYINFYGQNFLEVKILIHYDRRKYSFSTFAKFPRKTIISYPLIRTRVRQILSNTFTTDKHINLHTQNFPRN